MVVSRGRSLTTSSQKGVTISPSEILPPEPQAATAVQRESAAYADPNAPGETLYLTGRPTVKRFLRFVRSQAVHQEDESALIAEWQRAK